MRVKVLQQTVDAITAKKIALLAEHNTAMIAVAYQPIGTIGIGTYLG